MKMKAEIGLMFLQYKGHQRLSANHQELGDSGLKPILPDSPEKGPTNPLVLDF